MIAQLVLRDPPQPAAKRVSVPFLAKSYDMHDDRLEHLLKNVGGFLAWQTSAAAPFQDQRGVETDQPLPSIRLVGLHARKQAPRRRRGRRRSRIHRCCGNSGHAVGGTDAAVGIAGPASMLASERPGGKRQSPSMLHLSALPPLGPGPGAATTSQTECH